MFLYNQRGHQILRVIAVDAATGKVQTIVDEQSPTFIDYSGKSFFNYLDDSGEIIWMSERDGWNHLYLYDAKTGSVKNQITKGEWVVRSVDKVDEKKRQIYFYAGGIRPGQDPYYLHYCRVNFDGTGLTILTEGDGTHSIKFSPDRQFFIDTCSRVDLPPVNELRRMEDGSLVCKLEEADWSELLKTGWKMPERFVAKGRDGTTDIYGVIFRPTNFDPAKKYPVIEDIYAGPQDSFVPKSFRPHASPAGTGRTGIHPGPDRRHGHVEPLEKIPRRLLEKSGRFRLPRSHPVDQSRRRKISLHGPYSRRHLWRFGGRTKLHPRADRPRRFLQSCRLRLRMPRQPHG